ncbi:MAG: hypothetical protein P4L54_06660 [Acidocella sp.]|nr:hypothetical protein [Acidocella sp.]
MFQQPCQPAGATKSSTESAAAPPFMAITKPVSGMRKAPAFTVAFF